jgi:hypothetical protein
MQHTIAGCKPIGSTVTMVFKYPLSGITDNWDFLT